MIDVVQLVKEGKARFEWHELTLQMGSHTLFVEVFRDAMKFEDIPALTWDFKPVPGNIGRFDGVRLPASAYQLQQIADLVGGMLMTPKIIDEIWLQSNIRFDCITSVGGIIVANADIHKLHQAIENKILDVELTSKDLLVSCVGKYWCLINDWRMNTRIHGGWVACNYGWFATHASGPCLSPETQCWQRPGFRHNFYHWDPSQTIRLMNRKARLVDPAGVVTEVDLHDLADSQFAQMFNHDGFLTYLRQNGVPKLDKLPENILLQMQGKQESPKELETEPPKPESQEEKEKQDPDKQANIFKKILQFILSFFKHRQ